MLTAFSVVLAIRAVCRYILGNFLCQSVLRVWIMEGFGAGLLAWDVGYVGGFICLFLLFSSIMIVSSPFACLSLGRWRDMTAIIRASTRENLSSEFATR